LPAIAPWNTICEYAVIRHQATPESVLHTVSIRAPHACTVLCGQTVHVSHRPFSAPLHPLARYRPAVHVAQAPQTVPPTVSRYVPAAHRRHVDVWLLGLNVPIWQGVHTAFWVGWQLSPQDWPAMHVWQASHWVPPVPAWYLPFSHPMHAASPVIELYVPGWQAGHTRSALARQAVPWYVPAAQFRQLWHVTPRTPVWYVPAPQASQVNRPNALTYVPARQLPHTPSTVAVHPLVQTCPLRQAVHATHDVNPLPVRNVPAEHPMQVDFSVAPWYVPGEQSAQTLDSTPVWNWPARQILHSMDPSAFWYSPALHSMHRVPSENIENLPTGQSWHAEYPFSGVKRPYPHSRHAVCCTVLWYLPAVHSVHALWP
jgi:hypothetical protein